MSATLFVLNRRVAFGTLKAGSLFKRGIVIRQQRCNFGTTVAVTSDPETEKYRMTTIRLYRVLQRTCKSFPVESKQDPILLQQELKAPDWGHHSIFTPPSPTMVEELYRLFYVYNDPTDDAAFAPTSIDDWYFNVVGKVSDEDMPPMTTFTCWTSPEQLRYAIRAAFRLNYDLDAPILHKWAIRAIQILQEQRTMWTSSSVATAEGIRVTATSRCIGRVSTPASVMPPAGGPSMLENKHRFTYRIRVENLSDQCVQLLGRYWHIQEVPDAGEPDATNEPVVVDAPYTGAVGHLPVLRPGQAFEYMSGTDLTTSRGVMKGHFYMVRVPDNATSAKSGDDIEALHMDEKLEIAVAAFPLVAL